MSLSITRANAFLLIQGKNIEGQIGTYPGYHDRKYC
jgi:hypothetical protein